MKNISFAVLMVLLTTNMAFGVEESIEEKITKLNSESIRSLGISLKELGYLSQISKGKSMPLWAAERTGEIRLMRSLEKAGYVQVVVKQGLPDGTRKDVTFVKVTSLTKGKLVCDSI